MTRTALAVVQTPREWIWAYHRAVRHTSVRCYVLPVGDAVAAWTPEHPPAPNCTVVQPDELELDLETIWREAKALRAELTGEGDRSPARTLAVGPQNSLGESVLHLAHLEAVVAGAFRKVSPSEVWVPPTWRTGRVQGPLTAAQVRGIVRFVAARSGVRRRLPWSAAIHEVTSTVLPRFLELTGHLVPLAYDLVRVTRWAAFSAGRAFAGPRRAHEVRGATVAGRIVISNADSDLHRQFDLARLPPSLAERCVVWLGMEGARRLLAPLWTELRLCDHLPAGAGQDGRSPVAREIRLASRACRVFPTLVTPLLRRNRTWFCSAFGRPLPAEGSPPLREFLGSALMADTRYRNWRTLLHAAKRYAFATDALRHERPALFISGDTVEAHRISLLAARSLGIPTLATAHALDIGAEIYSELAPVADVHCLFGAEACHLAPSSPLAGGSLRKVFYDVLTGTPAQRKPSPAENRRRVVVFTSIYACFGPRFSGGMFVRWNDYERDLYALVEELGRVDPSVEVCIKSHPVLDAYELYDQVARDFRGLVTEHVVRPWNATEPIPADVGIAYNCLSTLFFSFVDQSIPVITHHGALSPFAQRILCLGQLTGSAESKVVARWVEELLTHPSGALAERVRLSATSLYGRFVTPPQGGLAAAMRFTLAQRAGPADVAAHGNAGAGIDAGHHREEIPS